MQQRSASTRLVDEVLGTTHRSSRHLIEAVRTGLPVGTIDVLIQGKRISAPEVDAVIVRRKTLAHRKQIGTLTPDQSDRLVRVARMIALAEETFGSKEKAHTWLRRKTTALDGEAPLDLLDTTEGATEVETLLGRISYGLAT